MKNKYSTILLGLCMLVGCSGYDEVSPQAYEYSKALYSICNRADEAKLAAFLEKLSTAEEQNELSGKEAGWLKDIAATAQAGDWPAATQEARRLMEDQIKY